METIEIEAHTPIGLVDGRPKHILLEAHVQNDPIWKTMYNENSIIKLQSTMKTNE
jgi:hypothetical protein